MLANPPLATEYCKGFKNSVRYLSNKIILITNIPTPYRIPLFNELSRQLEDKGFRLKVIFGALGYPRRKWIIDMSECKFDYEVLSSKTIPSSNPEKISFTYSGLYHIISRECPSVFITNGFSIAATKLWWRSLFKKTPYIIWSGAISRNNVHDSPVRRLQRKTLIKRASGFIAYGTKAKEYLTSLGAKEDRIEIGINTVDTDFFQNETRRIRSNMVREKEKRYLLYIGHLTRGKRIDRLFYALRELLIKYRGDFLLKLVGSGPEMDNLNNLANQLNIIRLISMEGFKQKEEIPEYIAEADCFLFPSEYDVWGLVLVEAMAAGLPCIASVHAGATHDLIKDGVTGFAMDFSETEKVAEKINWILDNPELSKNIGRNASCFAEKNVNIEKSALGFVKSITSVYENIAKA